MGVRGVGWVGGGGGVVWVGVLGGGGRALSHYCARPGSDSRHLKGTL